MKTSIQKIFLFGVMILITLAFGRYSKGESQPEVKAEKIKLSPAALEETVIEAVKALETEEKEKAVERETNKDLPKDEVGGVLEVLEEKQVQKEEVGVAPNFSAAVVSVSNLNTRDVFFGYEDTRRWPMASITKLMTAAVAFQRIPQDSVIEVKSEDFVFVESAPKVKVGEKYSRDDILEIMLGTSSNEAAEAVANFFGRDKFLQEMNLKAAEWGLNDTNFKDPTGISVSNQSTASDLREMATRIYNEYPVIFEITRRVKVDVRELNSNKVFSLQSNNTFTARKDFLGGKTGYTDEAQQNLLSIFKYDSQPILIIVLGTSDRFGQTENLFDWYKSIYKR